MGRSWSPRKGLHIPPLVVNLPDTMDHPVVGQDQELGTGVQIGRRAKIPERPIGNRINCSHVHAASFGEAFPAAVQGKGVFRP